MDQKILETWAKFRESNEEGRIIDAPLLESLIERQENKQALEEELKRLVMTWYWDGFYDGKQERDEAIEKE